MTLEEMILRTASNGVELVALFYLMKTLPVLNELVTKIGQLTDRLDAIEKRIGRVEAELLRR